MRDFIGYEIGRIYKGENGLILVESDFKKPELVAINLRRRFWFVGHVWELGMKMYNLLGRVERWEGKGNGIQRRNG